MKLISQKVNLWGEIPLDKAATLCWIELAGRICYNSTHRIKPGSAQKFVKNALKPVPPHASILEHSNIVLRSKWKSGYPISEAGLIRSKINSNFIFTGIQHDRIFIYGNWRAFFEYCKQADSDFDFMSLPNALTNYFPEYEVLSNPGEVPYFAQAATVCFVTDRAVTHEIVRHRHKVAYSQRSQRYCNESNLEIVKPYWFEKASTNAQHMFLNSCEKCERDYRWLKEEGFKNQEARAVLPNTTATTIVVSAYLSEWDWIFYLRTSPAAYSAISELMNEAKKQMIYKQIIDPE